MHEDIENGFYNDPFEYDNLKEESFNDFESELKNLQEKTHFLKNYKGGEYIDPETENAKKPGSGVVMDRDRYRTANTERKTKRIAVGAWDDPTVDIEWPEPLVDAFMDELEEFKTKDQNTGYENKELNKRMKERWGNIKESGAKKTNKGISALRENMKKAQKRFNEAEIGKPQEGVFDDVKVFNCTCDGSVRETFNFSEIKSALWQKPLSKDAILNAILKNWDPYTIRRGFKPYIKQLSWAANKCFISLVEPNGEKNPNNLIRIEWTPVAKGNSESAGNQILDEVVAKNLTMDGSVREHFKGLADELFGQKVSKKAIQDAATSVYKSNYSFGYNRGYKPVVSKFSAQTAKAYIALDMPDGKRTADLILVTWTPYTEE